VRSTILAGSTFCSLAAAVALVPSVARAQPSPLPGGYPPAAEYPPPAFALPIIRDWNENRPLPFGYRKSTRIRTGLVVGGSILFGSIYLVTAAFGAGLGTVGTVGCANGVCGADLRPGKLLLLPVVGPFTLLGATTPQGDGILLIDGLLQVGGIAMLAAGIAAPRTVLVHVGENGTHWMPTPMILGPSSAGLGVVGTF
jgi:hypothetical protein